MKPILNPLKNILIELSNLIPSEQYQQFETQCLSIVLNFASGNINSQQFKDEFQRLIELYINSNGRNDVDFDKLIEQVIGSDTSDLPNVIIEMLGKRSIN